LTFEPLLAQAVRFVPAVVHLPSIPEHSPSVGGGEPRPERLRLRVHGEQDADARGRQRGVRHGDHELGGAREAHQAYRVTRPQLPLGKRVGQAHDDGAKLPESDGDLSLTDGAEERRGAWVKGRATTQEKLGQALAVQALRDSHFLFPG
jgi:hypothetical protein